MRQQQGCKEIYIVFKYMTINKENINICGFVQCNLFIF